MHVDLCIAPFYQLKCVFLCFTDECLYNQMLAKTVELIVNHSLHVFINENEIKTTIDRERKYDCSVLNKNNMATRIYNV